MKRILAQARIELIQLSRDRLSMIFLSGAATRPSHHVRFGDLS